MKKGILSLLIWTMPCILLAQTDTSHGVKWVEGLTWEQVKQKAKEENKYVFLDCFTTWCGPCKMMDVQVYGNDSLGDYFNRQFISVKVQMDKTKKDNENVQRWYDDVTAIQEKYHINVYPSLIFLSPQGTIVDKQIGFTKVDDLIALAKRAVSPGKDYNDPYAEYNDFVAEYKGGNKNYDHYPAMITIAKRVNENDFVSQLLKELTAYVITLPRKERYTKERIAMWNLLTFSSGSNVFRFFYQDGKLIDKVMKQKRYASKFVDRTIQSEIVTPFLIEQNKNKDIAMTGMFLTGKNLPSDSSEADWKKLEQIIEKKYNGKYAKRNVLAARVEWYNRHRNFPAYAKYELSFLNKYWSLKYNGSFGINNYAWAAFMYSTDKKVIDGYIKWMGKAIVVDKSSASFDTYANLLYKSGRTKEGIEWEEKARNLVDNKYKKLYSNVIEQMQKGEPTYGAVWVYK